MVLDLSNVADASVHPAGEFEANVSNVEVKTSKSGHDYLNLTFRTDHGNLWAMFNVWHANEKPKNIALQQLKRLLQAANVKLTFESTEDLRDSLLGARVVVVVSHKIDEFGTKPEIKTYKPSGKSNTLSGVMNDLSEIPF